MKRKLTIGLLCALALAVCSTTLMASEGGGNDSFVQRSVTVSGVVKDAAGAPIMGVTVLQAGSTSNATSTGPDGSFSIAVPEGSELQFSYIGYQTVQARAAQGMSVVLKEDTQMLDDIVVVGFGTQRKANLTGAVSSVDVERTFGSKPIIDMGRGLQGVVPGLTITYSTNDLGASPVIKVRGNGSVNGNNTPLILLDGVEIEDISFVNPDNIANISVLKDAASSSIYGSRAAYGVVLITSKDGSELRDKVRVSYSNNFSWNEPIALPKYNSGYNILAEMDATMLAQKNVDGSDIEAFGMYYKDIKPKIADWLDNYWGQDLGQTYVYGRDYEFTASGTAQFYRVSDPNKELFKSTAFQQTHNLSVAGNSGKTNYNISMGYNKQDGIMKEAQEQYLQRITANISTNTQVYKWLNVGTKVMYTDKTIKFPRGYESSAGSGGLIYYTMRFPTFFPFGISDGGMQSDGTYISEKSETGKGLYFRHGNGLIAYAPVCTSTDEFLRLGANIKLQLYKGLTFSADYTRGSLNYLNKTIAQPEYVANWWSSWAPKQAHTSTDQLSNTWVRKRSNTYNAYFDYVFSVANDHSFAVKLGFNAEDLTYESNTLASTGLLSINVPTMNMTTGKTSATVGGALADRSTAGFFARINYNWREKLLLELNGRYDGSSMFKEGEKWAFFPSASIGYRISEEEFMKNQHTVSNLKIRASYGSIGNQDISTIARAWYPYIPTISSATADWLTANGKKPGSMGMPSVVGSSMTWEKINTIDVGFDLGLFRNELNVTFDWYQRRNIGMLVPRNEVPAIGGFPSLPKENSGDLRTNGWELQVDYNHNFNQDWSIYATATISDSRSKITKWNESVGLLTGNYEGKVLGEIWGFKTADGYFTAAEAANGVQTAQGVKSIADYQGNLEKSGFHYGEGDVKYLDLDGDGNVNSGEGTIDNHGDLVRIGNSLPRYEYSLRVGARWKGIDLEILFQGVGKRDMWTTSSIFIPYAAGAQMAIFSNQLDYYTPENPDARFPRPYIGHTGSTVNGLSSYTGNNNYYPQSKYLADLSYLRIKNLTVGYTLPQRWTRKAYIERARIYFSVNNLLTFDKIDGVMDPEITGGWNSTTSIDTQYAGRVNPFYRTWSFGVQINF